MMSNVPEKEESPKELQPGMSAPATEDAASAQPAKKLRWGRGVYGSKDVPIRALDTVIGIMIVAAVLLTLIFASGGGFAIHFDTGVTGVTVENQKVRYGNLIAEPQAPERPGYVLARWSPLEDGTGEWNFASTKVQNDVTLYAVWEPAQFAVKFDAAGGTLPADQAEKTVTYGEAYGTLPTPTKEGCSFSGWLYSGQTITADTVVSMTGEHVLTAQWA